MSGNVVCGDCGKPIGKCICHKDGSDNENDPYPFDKRDTEPIEGKVRVFRV